MDYATEGNPVPHSGTNARFRKYAGTVVWPRTPDALTDTTKCPACLVDLTSTVCRNCGLDLGHPAASELAKLSTTAATVLSQRVNLIGLIRFETDELITRRAETAALAPAAVSTVAEPAPATEAAPAPIVAAPVPIAPAPIPPGPPALQPTGTSTAAQAPRRSSVQIALLIVGVSLLSIFAIFFLVYAFINYGLIWRSVIIASITIAAFVAASVLRRRSLTASAWPPML